MVRARVRGNKSSCGYTIPPKIAIETMKWIPGKSMTRASKTVKEIHPIW